MTKSMRGEILFTALAEQIGFRLLCSRYCGTSFEGYTVSKKIGNNESPM